MRSIPKLIYIGVFLVLAAAVALGSAAIAAGSPYQPNMPKAVLDTLTALFAIALIVERAMTVLNAILYGDEQRTVELERNEKALAEVYQSKERARLLGAFVVGLFVSASGVRTLEWLMVIKDGASNPLLKPVDVLLTALLIAGGSNGLAYLLGVSKLRLNPDSSAKESTDVKPATKARELSPAPQPISPALRARLITTG